jgi:hypothetical protein
MTLSAQGLIAVSLALALLLAQSPAPAQTPPAYPLKPSANGRYLVDQLNAPFLLLGDSPQALIVNLSETDADTFFANRSTYGINTVWINLLCASYTGGRPDASTIDGLLPFTGFIPFSSSYDLATTNEPYFAHVDRILTLAAEHGIQVLLDPAETGSFLSVMLDNGPDKCRAYGQFLGRRYRDQPNIIWMSGNDFQTWRNPDDDAVVRAVALGIRDFDTNHLQTTELDYVVSSSLDDANWAPLLRLNGTYTYYPNAASATGLGTTAACGPINVSASNELLFAAAMTATTFTSAGSGFTTRLITSPDADLVADRLAPGPGSYNATAALSSGAWLMQLAAFKPLNSPLARPLLRIQLASPNTALIAWPAAATGFVLQQTSSLAAANWSNATNPVTVVGAEYQATLSLTDSNQFYRLRHP